MDRKGFLRQRALTDIYALGCMLYELLTGKVPFPGGDNQQKVTRHHREIPQRLDELNPQLPAELADLVDEMLAKDPVLRLPIELPTWPTCWRRLPRSRKVVTVRQGPIQKR